MARLEFEPSHTALIVKRPAARPEDGGMEFRVASLGAFLFEDKLVLVHSDGLPLFEGGRALARCNSLRGVLLQLIYRSTAQFMRDVRLIHQVSQSIEDHIEYSLGNKALSSMFDLQKGLVYYQSALQSNQVLLSKLSIHGGRIGFTPEEREFLDDLIVENEQCLKLVEMHSHILTDMSDARVSIINNNLTILMKKLTVISTIFLPLNLIASMGGMSEWTVATAGMPMWLSYSLFSVLLVAIGWVTWKVIRNVGIEDRPHRKRRSLRQAGPGILRGLAHPAARSRAKVQDRAA